MTSKVNGEPRQSTQGHQIEGEMPEDDVSEALDVKDHDHEKRRMVAAITEGLQAALNLVEPQLVQVIAEHLSNRERRLMESAFVSGCIWQEKRRTHGTDTLRSYEINEAWAEAKRRNFGRLRDEDKLPIR